MAVLSIFTIKINRKDESASNTSLADLTVRARLFSLWNVNDLTNAQDITMHSTAINKSKVETFDRVARL